MEPAGFLGLSQVEGSLRKPGANGVNRSKPGVSVFEGLCMHPRQLRVGDLVDDYCPRERRLSNHAVVALVGDDIRQVRCTTCDGEHEYRAGKLPASRRKKPVAGPPALAPVREAAALPAAGVHRPPPGSRPPAAVAAAPARLPRTKSRRRPTRPRTRRRRRTPSSLHRRLIRATLPRIEGDAPARPIPEFTMHRAAPAGHGQRHGKPFRHGQGGGQPRHGAKGGFGQGRHGQGEANGNTFGPPRGPHGQRGGREGPAAPMAGAAGMAPTAEARAGPAATGTRRARATRGTDSAASPRAARRSTEPPTQWPF